MKLFAELSLLNASFQGDTASENCFSEFGEPYKFTGKELDEETGLYYFGARYYDPVVSQWVSTDPPMSTGEYFPTGKQLFFPEDKFDHRSLPGIGGVYNSVNLNVYHYAGQNPVKHVDPDGNYDLLEFAVDIHIDTENFRDEAIGKSKQAWSEGRPYSAAWYSYCAGANGLVALLTPSNYTEAGGMAFTAPLAITGKIAGAVEKQASNIMMSEKHLLKHFTKHGSEMGFKNPKDYLNAAKSLFSKKGENILRHKSEEGTQFIYDAGKNELGIFSKDGRIETFFKPERGIEYFKDQVKKYK